MKSHSWKKKEGERVLTHTRTSYRSFVSRLKAQQSRIRFQFEHSHANVSGFVINLQFPTRSSLTLAWLMLFLEMSFAAGFADMFTNKTKRANSQQTIFDDEILFESQLLTGVRKARTYNFYVWWNRIRWMSMRRLVYMRKRVVIEQRERRKMAKY